MKKTYTYVILSVILLILGIVFTICGVLLQSLPLSSKSALLIFSTAFIIIGACASTVYYRKYLTIKNLVSAEVPVIAKWSYAPNSSPALNTLIKNQKSDTLATSLLILILALIFSFVFAYSGGSHILYLGYTFALLSLLTFIITQRFLNAYYTHLATLSHDVIFGEDSIYFLDEIYPLEKVFYTLEKVHIYIGGQEALLILDYNPYDVDDPTNSYNLVIPIPPDQIKMATYLKHYYEAYISSK